jgi:hypothetical protein
LTHDPLPLLWVQLCYAVQPSRTLARPLVHRLAQGRPAAVQAAYSRAMARATATVQRMSWLSQRAPGLDAGRLTTGLAESICLRAAAKPGTLVFKLWASYKLVLLVKRPGDAAAEGQAAGQRRRRRAPK